MIKDDLDVFRGKRVLLLQGPVGSFFFRLAQDLKKIGADVYKVNFNAGDWVFYPTNTINFRKDLSEWPSFFRRLLIEKQIDIVMLFGDSRPIHQAILPICIQNGLKVGVFEEGYVRPDYVTFEWHGVNGFSNLPKNPRFYRLQPLLTKLPKQSTGRTYWHMIVAGFWYFTIGALGKPLFPKYKHHRKLSLLEAFPWLRSVLRKWLYKWRERGVEDILVTSKNKSFYLVPLQVYNDAQIGMHSRYENVSEFIDAVCRSFKDHADQDNWLVFKHHPMDRGYVDYTKVLRSYQQKYGLKGRLLYIHDQHLPRLLDAAKGVVVINSTVGLSAVLHKVPLKVMGKAIYDINGITFQGELDQFWAQAASFNIDQGLFNRFYGYLVKKTQLNGSFYKPFRHNRSFAGLLVKMPKKQINELKIKHHIDATGQQIIERRSSSIN